MAERIVVCATCGAETAGPPASSCAACGAHLRVLEPMVVECGWCGRSNPREQLAHCISCGGPLPALPGGEPGPRPPAAPRTLPDGYVRRVRLWKNVLVIIGLVFSVLFCWTVVFPLIGLPLLFIGNRRALERLHALRDGRATRGRIVSVGIDRSETINGKHPWRVCWEFDRHDGPVGEGMCRVWDPVSAQRAAGDAVWVVYGARGDREVNAIWPPLR